MILLDDGGSARNPLQQTALFVPLALALLCIPSPASADQGGPDEFGYVWIDSDESGGPSYSLDFSPLSSSAAPLVLDDDSSSTIAIGFTFTFYGQDYNQLHVQSNGGITFGPDDSPLLHAFWYKGSPNSATGTNRNCETLTWSKPTIAGY